MMNRDKSTLLTSDYSDAFIAHESDSRYPCRAATLQTLDKHGASPEPFLTLAYKDVAGLTARIGRDLQFVKHDIQPSLGSFELHLSGKDSIAVGLKALFKQSVNGWEDNVVSRPMISPAMQDALLDQCSDFLKRAEDMPSPDEF